MAHRPSCANENVGIWYWSGYTVQQLLLWPWVMICFYHIAPAICNELIMLYFVVITAIVNSALMYSMCRYTSRLLHCPLGDRCPSDSGVTLNGMGKIGRYLTTTNTINCFGNGMLCSYILYFSTLAPKTLGGVWFNDAPSISVRSLPSSFCPRFMCGHMVIV